MLSYCLFNLYWVSHSQTLNESVVLAVSKKWLVCYNVSLVELAKYSSGLGLDFSLIVIDWDTYQSAGRGVRQTTKSSNGKSRATSKARAIPCKLYLRVPRARPYRVCSQRAAIFKTSIDSGRGSTRPIVVPLCSLPPL